MNANGGGGLGTWFLGSLLVSCVMLIEGSQRGQKKALKKQKEPYLRWMIYNDAYEAYNVKD